MCVSARASLGAFFTNLISCIALLVFGNKDLKHYNLFTAIFLTFVYVLLANLILDKLKDKIKK